MKKIFVLFITMLFMMPNVYADDEKTKFSLTDVTASAGSSITMKLNVENNPSFGILAVKLHYDMEKLEYISSEVKGMDNALLKNAESNDKGMIALYALTLDTDKLMDDTGTLLILEFKINEDVEEDLNIKVEVTDFGVDENNLIEFESSDGTIFIKDEIVSVTNGDDLSLKDEVENNDNIVWESSDSDIATVDEEGNVEFKSDGNVSIKATEDDEVVYEKDYYVKDKVNNDNKGLIIFIVIAVVILLIVGIIVFKKLRKKKKNG